jgi:hypothetical protein
MNAAPVLLIVCRPHLHGMEREADSCTPVNEDASHHWMRCNRRSEQAGGDSVGADFVGQQGRSVEMSVKGEHGVSGT